MTILFGNPIYIWLIPFAVFALFLVIWKNFFGKKSDKKQKLIFFSTRSAILALLILSIANPFSIQSKIVDDDPRVAFLIDESKSMDLFKYDLKAFSSEIKKRMPVVEKKIAFEESSNIGDGILNNIERNGNILLYSDGQITSGASFDKIASLVLDLNATINILNINPDKKEASVSIIGPSETVQGVDTNFLVKLEKIGFENVPLKVTVDSKIVYDDITKESVKISRPFLEYGYHTIKAEINIDDEFKNNNVFYKTIKVIDKPKILYLSTSPNPIENIINKLYEVDEKSYMPDKLDEYYAIIVNDMKSSDIKNLDVLEKFLIDNNGLFVIGGFRSFENGGYKDSNFLQMLPVDIGTGTPDKGAVNILILIDISGSTGHLFGTEIKVNVEKAMALSTINNLRLNNKVGILAFNQQAYLVSDIRPLFDNKAEIEDKVSRLKHFGATYMGIGLSAAYQMISKQSGNKYIIVISDGITQDSSEVLDLALAMSRQGIKIISIGVGEDTNVNFMTDLARIGNGFYLQPTQQDRIKVLFGDLIESKGDRFGLTVIDENHFITNGISEISAVLDGYNQVVPKPQASLLISSDSGRPALSVWRFGLGRVAAMTVFSSSDSLGQLLNKENSNLITRIINWGVGNPERKRDSYIKIKDIRQGDKPEVILKSPLPPKSDINFKRFEEDKYIAELETQNITGIFPILDGFYSVNYKAEYENFGISKDIKSLVQLTGGKIFNFDDIEGIVEHVKEKSKRLENRREDLTIYFILPMIIIFLIEVSFRRWREVKE